MRNVWRTGMLLVCAIVTWAQGAASHQRPALPPAKHATGQARVSDAQLEAAIKAKFAKSKSAAAFTVRVQGGVASIEGKTDVGVRHDEYLAEIFGKDLHKT